MAKAIKTKKEKTVIEPIIEETKIETPIESVIEKEVKPDIGDTPPSVTLDEVKEVKEPESAKPIISEIAPLYTPEQAKEIVEKWEGKQELSNEQKILNYIEDKSGEIRLNEFLKSLFPMPKNGEPFQWLQQGISRTLRGMLETMQANNQLTIVDNKHRLLGQSYYPDSTTGKQQHHNLNTVIISVKK